MRAQPVKQKLLPYVGRLQQREVQSVDLVVIHCTELPDLVTAREYAEKIHYSGSVTGNSGHFYVDRDGSIEQWAPIDRVAHHVVGYNQRSLGIELVNSGRFPDWLAADRQQMTEKYTEAQIDALVSLLAILCSRQADLAWIAGHEHLDTGRVPASDRPGVLVRRKCDPGPLFPWKTILRAPSLRGQLCRFPPENGSS
jgi:N-acetylmuramoyl-L-alanine amidase